MLNLLSLFLPFLLLAVAFSLGRVFALREAALAGFSYRVVIPLMAVTASCMELILLNGARRSLELMSPDAVESLRSSSFIYAYAGNGLLIAYVLAFGFALVLFLAYAFRGKMR